MGSSNWGVIHNQSNQEITYILHSDKLTPVEAKITLQVGAAIKGDLSGPSAQISGAYKQEIIKLRQKIDCVYNIKPGRISTLGLLDIDFDEIKFATITRKGQILMNSGKVSQGQHLRLKIRSDGGIKDMSKKEAQKLKQFSKGTTIESKECPIHEETTLGEIREYQQSIRCEHCEDKFEQIWTCRVLPTHHVYCTDCLQFLLQVKKYNIQKKKREQKGEKESEEDEEQQKKEKQEKCEKQKEKKEEQIEKDD